MPADDLMSAVEMQAADLRRRCHSDSVPLVQASATRLHCIVAVSSDGYTADQLIYPEGFWREAAVEA